MVVHLHPASSTRVDFHLEDDGLFLGSSRVFEVPLVLLHAGVMDTAGR